MSRRLPYLDLLRGFAALAVCAGHLRAFLFVDFGQVTSPGIFDRLFYFVTGLGHQAVVVFFVLSGYLVGGSVLSAYQCGRWSWPRYALRRLTRLWVVLLPALVLTLALDSLGCYLRPAGYEGALNVLYNSGPSPDHPVDLRGTTFLGNAFFLQTIRFNCFGTNGPLWSLANEFWYYALFPFICGAIFVPAFPLRALNVMLTVVVIWCLPGDLVWGGTIWLMGVGVFWAGQFESIRLVCRRPVWSVGLGLFVLGTLAASKRGSQLRTDWIIGIASALWVAGLAGAGFRLSWIKRVASSLSEMSYTLYVVHFPLLAFVFYCFFGGRQFQPGPASYLWFGALLIGSVAFAAVFWWCFERNTERLRKRIERLTFLRTLAPSQTAN